MQAKQLTEITVSWLQKLQAEVSSKALVKVPSDEPMALASWSHGRSTNTGVKAMVQPAEPQVLLKNIFDAFPSLEIKVMAQADLDEHSFVSTGETIGSCKALRRLHKRSLPNFLHDNLNAKFSTWMVRNSNNSNSFIEWLRY